MSPTVMSIIRERAEIIHDDTCPDYEAAVSRSNSNATTTTGRWSISFEDPPTVSRGNSSRSHSRRERHIYTYNLLAGATPLQFVISVEPTNDQASPGNVNFGLSMKANGVERPLSEPVSLNLTVDPRSLEFVVFIFPGKTSLPAGCLYSLRVWLRLAGTDHRLFGEDDIWVGKDPDFNAIGDASYARLKAVETNQQLYHGFVGRALVNFIIRWRRLDDNLYRYSMDYESNGAGANLFSDYRLRVDGDPRTVTFLIYAVPITSMPAGASHRLRVWLRSLVSLSSSDPSTSYVLPFNDSYIYQRIYKSDSFKIGAKLDFSSLGSKVIMGFSSGPPQTVVLPSRPPRETAVVGTSRRGGYLEKLNPNRDY